MKRQNLDRKLKHKISEAKLRPCLPGQNFRWLPFLPITNIGRKVNKVHAGNARRQTLTKRPRSRAESPFSPPAPAAAAAAPSTLHTRRRSPFSPPPLPPPSTPADAPRVLRTTRPRAVFYRPSKRSPTSWASVNPKRRPVLAFEGEGAAMVPLLACSPASRASIRRCARLRPTRPSASCASMKERIAVLLVPDASASKVASSTLLCPGALVRTPVPNLVQQLIPPLIAIT
jgi:hypothetical protein